MKPSKCIIPFVVALLSLPVKAIDSPIGALRGAQRNLGEIGITDNLFHKVQTKAPQGRPKGPCPPDTTVPCRGNSNKIKICHHRATTKTYKTICIRKNDVKAELKEHPEDYCGICSFCRNINCSGHGEKTFECRCEPGWMGALCEVDADDCRNVECGGHGTCIDGDESYECQCEPGWIGALCEMDATECRITECSGHGTCIDGDQSFECQCEPGWLGERCELEANPDPCINVNCTGHGTCIDGDQSFQCQCEPGWNGTLCEEDVDECWVGTHNCSATTEACANLEGGHYCYCQEGFDSDSDGVCRLIDPVQAQVLEALMVSNHL
jgi:hypothetical protein